MVPLYSSGKTWDFHRSARGEVSMRARAVSVPHWIGEGKTVEVTKNPLNAGVSMVRLSLTYQNWAREQPLAVVGEVAAGRYDVTVAYHLGPEALEVLHVPPEWGRAGYFALQVRGNSMQEAGIGEGDYVIVRPQSSADDGDLVVAGLVDSDDPSGYVTLKQFFREVDHIRLQPANAAMAPIHLYPQRAQDPVEIQGKVVAVVRLEEEDWLE